MVSVVVIRRFMYMCIDHEAYIISDSMINNGIFSDHTILSRKYIEMEIYSLQCIIVYIYEFGILHFFIYHR